MAQDESFDIQIKRLEDCTFRQAVELWNVGFSGYYSDMSTTMDKFIPRMGRQSIRPELSVAAFIEGQPAGFVLIALKNVDGSDIAWNGGTGVNPSFRGRGVAKRIMQEAVQAMRESGAAYGVLEVVQKNEGAIAAYKSAGFVIRDGLLGARQTGSPTGFAAVDEGAARGWRMETMKPQKLVKLPFFRREAAWSSSWFNLLDAEAVVVYDKKGAASAYAILRRSYDADDKLKDITLYQCEVDQTHSEHKLLVDTVLKAAFGPLDAACNRSTDNLSMSDSVVLDWLTAAGFETKYTQYLMILNL